MKFELEINETDTEVFKRAFMGADMKILVNNKFRVPDVYTKAISNVLRQIQSEIDGRNKKVVLMDAVISSKIFYDFPSYAMHCIENIDICYDNNKGSLKGLFHVKISWTDEEE